MDGDSSTTDASQLGIAGDYIGGSHYVIQPHDGKKWDSKCYFFSAYVCMHKFSSSSYIILCYLLSG